MTLASYASELTPYTAEELSARASVLKTCSCGLAHTREQWSALEYVGPMPDDEGDLELRNCGCGSTICVRVEELAS